jgi:WD40 repeat protein
MIVLDGHKDSVNAVTFSPDGRWLASAGDDGNVWLWDLALEVGRVRIGWGARFVFSLAFSPDGETLAVGTEGSVLLLREREGQWRPHQQWKDHRTWVTAVAFDSGGQLLASGGVDGNVRVWDATHRRRKPLRQLSVRMGPVRSLAFSPDGAVVAAGGISGLGLWSATDAEPILFQRLRDADARGVAFARDGRSLLATTGRALLRIDAQSFNTEELLTGRPNFFRCLDQSPTHPLMLVGCDDGTVRTLDPAGSDSQPAKNWHLGTVNSVAFHPSGLMAASAGDDRGVCFWNLDLSLADSDSDFAALDTSEPPA